MSEKGGSQDQSVVTFAGYVVLEYEVMGLKLYTHHVISLRACFPTCRASYASVKPVLDSGTIQKTQSSPPKIPAVN